MPDPYFVFVSYSSQLLKDAANFLPPHSVVVLEEPQVIVQRRVRERVADNPTVREVIEGPTQRFAEVSELDHALRHLEGRLVFVPATEYGVPAAALLSEQRGSEGLGVRAARAFRDKAYQREVAEQAGVPQPRFRVCRSLAEAECALVEFGGRGVVKPQDRQGSLGVTLVRDRANLEDAWARAVSPPRESMWAGEGRADRLLVEELVEGSEYSLEAEVLHGRIVNRNLTRKRLFPGDLPVELGHAVPDASPGIAADLAAHLELLVAAAGVGTGFLHSEWKLSNGGPRLIECAARLPGDGIHSLISLAYGINVTREFLDMLADGTRPDPWVVRGGAAVRFLQAPPGPIATVSGLMHVREMPDIIECHVDVQPGDSVPVVNSSYARVGHVVATGSNADVAEATAERAASEIVFSQCTDRAGCRTVTKRF